MQTQLIEKQEIRAIFSVTVPADEVNGTYRSMLKTLARQVKVPGFRPGKAPRGVIEAKVGKEALAHEVRDALVETYYPKAVRELELVPASVTRTEAGHPVEDQDYSFEVEVELFPEISLPDISQIVIDTEAQTVSEDMFNETVETLRGENATLVPVERPAEAGDYLIVETLGEGEGSTLPIDLEKVDPELGNQLVGKSIGDEVELKFAAAQPTPAPIEEAVESDDEGAQAEAAAETEEETPEGAPALKVVVKDIKAKEKPAADDELAKTLGYETWQETEAAIRKSLQAQLDQQALEEQREEFIDKLVAESEFELPESLVNRRKQSMLENLVADLQKRGMTLKEYIDALEEKGGREQFDRELDETARQGVKRDLLLERLLETRGTELSDEEFGAALRHMAERQRMDVPRFRREMGDEWLANYRFLLTRDKTVREVVRELVGNTEGEAEAETEARPTAEAAGE